MAGLVPYRSPWSEVPRTGAGPPEQEFHCHGRSFTARRESHCQAGVSLPVQEFHCRKRTFTAAAVPAAQSMEVRVPMMKRSAATGVSFSSANLPRPLMATM